MLIKITTEDDWKTLRDIRLAALLDAPKAFGVSHASALAYTEAQWRERASGRGPATYLLALSDTQSDYQPDSQLDSQPDSQLDSQLNSQLDTRLDMQSDNAAVGLVAHLPGASGEWNLIAMWVSPQYRGNATATALVDAVKARAIAAGQARVVLDVSPDNLRAAAFYRRQGFVFLPEREALDSHPEVMVQKMEWLA